MNANTTEQILSSDTHMGAVTLRVADLDTMSDYYSNAFAMEPLDEAVQDGDEVHRVLGRGTTPLVRLIRTRDLPAVDPKQAGLFHTAFLFEDNTSLAATVYRAAQHPKSVFVGSSDHLVSEAFYFTDPEGNGVELYSDRPRDAWTYEKGEVSMATNYLDPNNFLKTHLTEDAVENTSQLTGQVGHVHLQVGDLATARAFYVDALGFEASLTRYPGAIFASAGGYHHHIAMNTWNSRGAGPRAASLGLGNVAIAVPTTNDLDALAARLQLHKINYAADGRSLVFADPWNTQVTVALPDLSVDEMIAR